VHRLQPFRGGPHLGFVRKTLMVAMAACVVIYLGLLAMGGGSQSSVETFAAGDLPLSIPFEITQANRIARLQLEGNVDNSWAYVAFEVEDPEGEVAFGTGRTISYYHGRDSEGSWSEGSQRTNLRFRPTTAGTHTLNITLEEVESRSAVSQFTLRLSEGALVARWFLFAALFFMIVWIIPTMRTASHQKARWSGWDWND